MNGLEGLSSEKARWRLEITAENDANPPSAARRGDFFFAQP